MARRDAYRSRAGPRTVEPPLTPLPAMPSLTPGPFGPRVEAEDDATLLAFREPAERCHARPFRYVLATLAFVLATLAFVLGSAVFLSIYYPVALQHIGKVPIKILLCLDILLRGWTSVGRSLSKKRNSQHPAPSLSEDTRL